MDFEKIINKAFDMLEQSLKDKKENRAAEMQRLTEIAREQEKTKRMGYDSQASLQNLVNKGLLDRQEIVNTGLIKQEQLKEMGFDRRQQAQNDFENNRPMFKEVKSKTTTAEGETETSDWKNVNTPAGRIDKTFGGTFDPSDDNFFKTRRSNVGSGQPTGNATRELTDNDRDFQTPVEQMPLNTGYVKLEGSGRTIDVGRDQNGVYQMTDRMPTRTHDLSGQTVPSATVLTQRPDQLTSTTGQAPLPTPGSGDASSQQNGVINISRDRLMGIQPQIDPRVPAEVLPPLIPMNNQGLVNKSPGPVRGLTPNPYLIGPTVMNPVNPLNYNRTLDARPGYGLRQEDYLNRRIY